MRNIHEIIDSEMNLDIKNFLTEIENWDKSLEKNDAYDEVVRNTLETVVDLVSYYCV